MKILIKKTNPVSINHNNFINKNCTSVTFDDGYQNFLFNALPILIKYNIPAIIFITSGYLGKRPGWIKNEKHENYNEILLNENQLINLPANLITIGSHCVSHPRLAKMQSREIEYELTESKMVLEKILNKPVLYFALPHGSKPANIEQIAKKVGYLKIFL
ncbi:MAG: polysaccharide deacetylase family protein, partial [Spirochaetes bacterium]|nr:polysaccharide deacetylase family protein [Spirochaetota bacterium]